MSKTILSIAMSLDGYISNKDKEYSWIKGDSSNIKTTIGRKHDFDYMLKNIDTIIMGFNSYNENLHENFKDKKIIVVTRKKIQDTDNLIFLCPMKALNYVKKNNENIYLFGGGITLTPFIEEKLIDEFEIAIVPVILGKGKKLFHEVNTETLLLLTDVNIEDGITILRYKKRV